MKNLKNNGMSTDKLVFLIIGGITVVILVFIILFSINEGKSGEQLANITTYTSGSSEKPSVSVSGSFADLGNMKVKDEKSADFTIENKGNKTLNLFKVSSSCDCTFGKLTIDGKTGQEFGMHATSNWVGTLDPGKKATLTVIYRPFIMPVKGTITRDVFMNTNDPDKGRLTFTVKANVE